ncbi:MAG: hypothetical protein K0S07_430 [Chlamydiales bacterium]|jgi:hypothetical protein|nr:hypothetical protein [Chlamydiales bacterium]
MPFACLTRACARIWRIKKKRGIGFPVGKRIERGIDWFKEEVFWEMKGKRKKIGGDWMGSELLIGVN